MKKQKSRELLLTTKAAQKWQESFDHKVDEIMLIVGKIDTVEQINKATEVMDVYSKKQKPVKYLKRKSTFTESRPFEFLVYNN
jgi:hypothetical protein